MSAGNYTLLKCDHCPSKSFATGDDFVTQEDFILHLRNVHCSKEGGSFVCKYGINNICQKLPFEGVSDTDYRDHVIKCHLSDMGKKANRNVNSKVQNLAAVLNDPRKSRREVSCFFTRYWSENFVEKTNFPLPETLPQLNARDFAGYLNKTLKRKKPKHLTPKFSDSTSQHGKIAVKDLVPEMFFSSKFNLEEPKCFEALFLTANLEIVPDVGGFSSQEIKMREKLKPTKLLEEKLSSYLDSIEIQIARHVASQSGSFFRAMTSHEDLQKSLAESLSKVEQMRRNLKILDENFTTKCLRLLNLKRRRSNRDELLKKVISYFGIFELNLLCSLELISTVKQTQSMVQMLLNSGDYLGALELINTTKIVLKNQLLNILCFRHLDAQLNELKICISKMLLEEFVRLLRRELDVENLLENGNDDQESIDETSFTTLIFAMCQTREFKFIHLLNEEVYKNVKILIRERIKRAVDPVDENCDLESVTTTKTDNLANESLADQMRKLEFDQWFPMFKHLIDDLCKYLTKVEQIKVILQKLVIDASQQSIDQFSEETDDQPVAEFSNLQENLDEFLSQSCTYTQERLVRVLIARCKDDFIEKLTIDQFLSLNNLNNEFYDFCIRIIYKNNDQDQIKRILPLKSYVHSLTIKFLHKFHEDRREKLGNILDLEHWRSARVPRLFQNLVDSFEKTGRFNDVSNVEDLELSCNSVLVVNKEEYAVVGVALIVVQLIAQYFHLMDDLPFYAADLLTMLIDLLKIFNSRTCQLILGAGALHLVGLKSIGVRNLALASRCLQLVLYFINRLKDRFQDFLTASNKTSILRHWTQLADDYQKHIDEIFEKLSTIMNDQMLMCLQKKLSFAVAMRPARTFAVFQKYANQCQRFYDNVKDVVPADQLRKILLRLHSNFKTRFKSRLSELNILPHSPSYSIACSEFSDYLSNLKTLNCCAAVEDTMQDVMMTG